MRLFGNQLTIFISDDFILPEDLIVWLEQAQYKPDSYSCVWQFLNTALKLKHTPANIFAQHDNISNVKQIMRADPVFLQAGWHGLVVADNKPKNLDLATAQTLADSISQDLSGLKLHCPQPYRWYLSGDNLAEFTSLPTSCVQNQLSHQIQNLPKQLLQQLNQIQINLHNHPVNRQRKQDGLAIINSLWCWGVSDLTATYKSKLKNRTIFSDNPEIKIYLTTLGIECHKTTDFNMDNNAILILDDGCDTAEKVLELLLNYQKPKQISYRGTMYY